MKEETHREGTHVESRPDSRSESRNESRPMPPAQASARQTEMGDQFDRTLFGALDALEERKIPYAIIGGIAASGLGRPRSTHDIDLFIRPEDGEVTIEALARHGFDTERTDERWLFKGWKEGMMVDIIFKSEGDIYFDAEMHQRARRIDYHGRKVPAVSPEDLIIIKSAVASEEGPHHWHDALAILSHATVDWDYLLRRARRATRRVLSLLIYAQANDIWIPNSIIIDLFRNVFGEAAPPHSLEPGVYFKPAKAPAVPPAAQVRPGVEAKGPARTGGAMIAGPHAPGPQIPRIPVEATIAPHATPEAYLSQKLREAIAMDTRTAALDIRILVTGQRLVARGEVQTEEQRRSIEDVMREHAPGYDVDNQVRCSDLLGPSGVEEVV